jgi:hypothetical protein
MQPLLRRHAGEKMQVLVNLLFVHISMVPHRMNEKATHDVDASFVIQYALCRYSVAERSHQTMA